MNLVSWAPATNLLSLYGAATWAKVGTASPQSQTHWGSTGSLSSPQWRLNPSAPLPSIRVQSPSRSPFLSHPNLPPTASCNDCPGPGEREDIHQAGPRHRVDSIPEHRGRTCRELSACPAEPQAREKEPLSTAPHFMRPLRGWLLLSLVDIQGLCKVTEYQCGFLPTQLIS